LRTEFAPVILMIRHATPGRRKHAHDTLSLLDVGRVMTFGIGPDFAENVIPWLKTNHRWPRFPWLFYARFKDETWIHCIASDSRVVSIDRLADNQKLQVLAAWFDPHENRSHARFYKAGVLAADLVAAGKGDDPLDVVSFQSSAHRKTVLNRCKTARDAVDSFFGALEAKPRDLAVIETIGSLELHDFQGRAIPVDELVEAALTYHAPVTAAENPASAQLLAAIQSGDLEAARQALADGASVEFLPDLGASPLSIVFDLRVVLTHACPSDWRGFAKLLVEAGASIDGYDWESSLICSAIHPNANERAIIECLQALLALGADINARDRGQNRGAAPLHLAVYYSFPEVVRFLINQGGSLDARDPTGKTPLECAESRARNDAKMRFTTDTDNKEARRRAQIVELLREGPSRSNQG
jgi:hypothetical protein